MTDDALAVGEKREVRVSARKFWNGTGIDVREGERYRLHADGKWRDLLCKPGPDGYDAPSYRSSCTRPCASVAAAASAARAGIDFMLPEKTRSDPSALFDGSAL